MTKLRNTEPVRLYLYPVVLALLGVLVHYKIVEPEAVPLWTVFAGAVLAVGGVEKARSLVSSPATVNATTAGGDPDGTTE